MQNYSPLDYYFQSSDERGSFKGVVNSGHWEEINIVHTQAGKIRGGHYHQQTTEIIFLVDGLARVELAEVDDPTHVSSLTLRPGQGVKIDPSTAHWLYYHEDSVHIQLLDHRFDPIDQDLIPFKAP